VSFRLLDVFCGPGGAGEGYRRAGFEVWGVDKETQRYFPGMFTQADALEFLADGGAEGFHAIHASPPCQRYSSMTAMSGRSDSHPDLIAPTRELLEATGLPYIIENVPRAPLIDPVLICGAALGRWIDEVGKRYILRRHRLFESNIPIRGTGCGCVRGDGITLGVYGGGTRQVARRDHGGGNTSKANLAQAAALIGMSWATRVEMNQAIPPSYTEMLGAQLLEHLAMKAAA